MQALTLDGAANAASAPSAMQVHDGVLRGIQVIHMADSWQVQAPCRLGGCYQEAGLIISESVQGLQQSRSCCFQPQPDCSLLHFPWCLVSSPCQAAST